MQHSPGVGEGHAGSRLGWLRAAVLGANDGLLSTSSLIIGVATANGTREAVLIAGLSGLVAGAMSMASGEYVSVSSQADSQASDIARERQELSENPEFERAELTAIYIERGLTDDLAAQLATQLMEHDPLAVHARDELGITDTTAARPIQAAAASAVAFSIGAALPLFTAVLSPRPILAVVVTLFSVVILAILGALGAKLGGAKTLRATIRVTLLGVLSMLVLAVIGHLALLWHIFIGGFCQGRVTVRTSSRRRLVRRD